MLDRVQSGIRRFAFAFIAFIGMELILRDSQCTEILNPTQEAPGGQNLAQKAPGSQNPAQEAPGSQNLAQEAPGGQNPAQEAPGG